jgi:L-alanine-DL-glutamate epimerase-like enolase superfamily enzyme
MPPPRLTFEPITLHLRNPFRLAYGVSDTREAFWLRLAGDEGWGEGTIPPYYRIDPSEMTACWHTAAQFEFPFPDEIAGVEDWIPDGPAPARSALEMALCDRIGRRANQPLYEVLGLPKPPVMATAFTISIDTPDAMAKMAVRIKDYPIIKLKLGSDDDEARVKAVRQARPDAMLMVDANAAWSLDEAIAHLKWLTKYDLELIEQPLPRQQLAEMGKLQQHTAIPIVADESVQTLEDVETLAAGGVRAINLKIMKVGGVTPALRILKRARELGMKIMLGCMMETSIGITAMAHFAGAADWLDLDAPLLITDDPFEGVTYDKRAGMHMPKRPGIGVIRREQEKS